MRRLILLSVVLALLVLAVSPAAAQPGVTTYTVRPGDSLTALAQRYGITIEELAVANNLTVTTRLLVGQQLVIPVAAPQAGALTTYRVQRGDTLSSIAARFNTTVQNLVALNGIANINRVYVGQVLNVPQVVVPVFMRAGFGLPRGCPAPSRGRGRCPLTFPRRSRPIIPRCHLSPATTTMCVMAIRCWASRPISACPPGRLPN